jgi:hypothetical protein
MKVLVEARFDVRDQLGLAPLPLRGDVSIEQGRRLDDVVIDADQDHVVLFHGVLLAPAWSWVFGLGSP